ncbi:bifunctional SAM-dependent methyltransferase RsmB-NOP2-type/RNA (C5-cytosine) methyltransferase/S-adenosyl-L-methionine-dependent methyltransferase superfamily [Babesia duncani]|uniref:Bifunctional SAM-dependent methyltransferase RsmB-NOP2-type/RNA (C5-cytosine) methyltransferase/S-adenosyl-L-methionine-dependent methyltransferase superfamily n=1 Tax=Babesia duncani TaxID=323732 RepID=A0AAD9UMU1_9APIC|nr:bifunctional SAM-dependent methyltransferase RsmB-NOP2-type/RNA (C5-cytosine) methyltransferase/S-adenosyl-L-methionine-dependent methyltransferase superfamily [Babesia duncani]
MLGINSKRAFLLENALVQYDKINTGNLGIDVFLKNYFRVNKSSPSTKCWISQHMYHVMRWKGLIGHLSAKPLTWSSMLTTYLMQGNRWRSMTTNKSLPEHVRCSFPIEAYQMISDEYGPEKAIDICNILNEEPVTFLRVNTLRISRDKAYKFLLHKGTFIAIVWHVALGIKVEKSVESHIGLVVGDKRDLLDSPEYKRKIVEIQDESSQLVGLCIQPKSGDSVLDFCAGSGGKSCIIGARMANKGRLYLYDVNEVALLKAKKRLYNAGIRNYMILDRNTRNLNVYHKKMDWVILDVPCSGSGAYRRNPDRKWAFEPSQLYEFSALQRRIIDESIHYLKPPNGTLVYSTSSIFKQENEIQVR